MGPRQGICPGVRPLGDGGSGSHHPHLLYCSHDGGSCEATISACGEQPPEEFIFRYGFVVFTVFLVVEAVVLYGAGLFSELCMVLGIVGGLCLGVVGVVSTRDVSSVRW